MDMITCFMCKETKNDEEFSWRRKGAQRQSHCKECQREYRKSHYEANKQKYIDKAATWTHGRLKAFHEWVSTQQCIDCGNNDPRVLEFDHVRGTKLGNISHMVGHVTEEALQEELAKCEIVCANCHRIRTATRGNWHSYEKALS